MSDQLLLALKAGFIVLLFLFVWRVLRIQARDLRAVPEIAGAHHEKLDGTGYPRKLRGEQIPVPARMMAISDIYDALTASDRPYKKAMPVEKALDILSGDVKRGQLDVELFDVFVGSRVWEKKPRAR